MLQVEWLGGRQGLNLSQIDQLEINGQYSEKVLPLDMKLRRTVRKEIVNQIFV